jgi:hypothetical protein
MYPNLNSMVPKSHKKGFRLPTIELATKTGGNSNSTETAAQSTNNNNNAQPVEVTLSAAPVTTQIDLAQLNNNTPSQTQPTQNSKSSLRFVIPVTENFKNHLDKILGIDVSPLNKNKPFQSEWDRLSATEIKERTNDIILYPGHVLRQLSAEEWQLLTEALHTNQNIKYLTFENCNLKDAATAEAFLTLIKQCSHLKLIDLSKSKIADEFSTYVIDNITNDKYNIFPQIRLSRDKLLMEQLCAHQLLSGIVSAPSSSVNTDTVANTEPNKMEPKLSYKHS